MNEDTGGAILDHMRDGAAYAKGPHGTCTLRWGPEYPAQLLVPVIP